METYARGEVFVVFSELRSLDTLMADQRRCVECGWFAWEGRHTNPCRDGADCGEPSAHHPFKAEALPSRHLILPTEGDRS